MPPDGVSPTDVEPCGCYRPPVILEHAVLPVRPGKEGDFLEAFGAAKQIIASMTGFRRLQLSRCIERPSTFLLLVEWETLEDHTQGFRSSAEYREWRRLLHHFYDPFPAVEHFKEVLEV
jgi:heme-degrading monooxygenase HmoA